MSEELEALLDKIDLAGASGVNSAFVAELKELAQAVKEEEEEN